MSLTGCWSYFLTLQVKTRAKGRGAKVSKTEGPGGITRVADVSGGAEEGLGEEEAADGLAGCDDQMWSRRLEEFLVRVVVVVGTIDPVVGLLS